MKAKLIFIFILFSFLSFRNFDKTLWLDEKITVYNLEGKIFSFYRDKNIQISKEIFVASTIKEVINSLKVNERGNALTYNVLLYLWIKLWGGNIYVLRAFSYIFALLTLMFLFFILRLLNVEINIIIWSLLFLAINPLFVFMSYTLRAYSLVIFLGVLSTYILLKILEFKQYNLINGILYLVSLFLALTSHYFAIFIYVAHSIYIFYKLFYGKRFNKEIFRYFIKLGVVTLVIIISLYFIYWSQSLKEISELNKQYALYAQKRHGWAKPFTVVGVIKGYYQLLSHSFGYGIYFGKGIKSFVIIPLIIINLFLVYKSSIYVFKFKKSNYLIFFFLSYIYLIVAPLIALKSGHLIPFHSRYISFYLPYIQVSFNIYDTRFAEIIKMVLFFIILISHFI